MELTADSMPAPFTDYGHALAFGIVLDGYAYLFHTGGSDLKGYQLVYKSPAAIINLPVEYELTDIPLP